MTKKHFIAFAKEINETYKANLLIMSMEQARGIGICQAKIIIAVAQQDNPRFDEERFLAACGLN